MAKPIEERRGQVSADSAPALFQEAMRHHRAGRLDEAERLYRQVIVFAPRHAETLHLLGALTHQAGRSAEAVALIRRAIQLRADAPAYHNNLGLALQAERQPAAAIASFERALTLDPRFVLAHNNLGVVLLSEGKLDECVAHFETVLALEPDNVGARINLGNALSAQGGLSEAIAQFDQALARDPTVASAHLNRGVALMWQNRLDEAFAAYRRHTELRTGNASSLVAGSDAAVKKFSSSRVRHDREQLDYLVAVHPEREDLRRLKAIAERSPEEFAVQFAAFFHLEGGEHCAGDAVNPLLDVGSIESRWKESRPQLVVIDDLLTPAALDELRRFCWEATVWRADYPNGYLGAFFADGFACPLLAQVAGELSAKLPGIIGNRPLRQLWGFKYDSERKGITVHADAAAINVNFWITPDDANLDPDHGGLVVWDVPAPLDWQFEKFQTHDARDIRRFLSERNAVAMTVPYRANRAVVFDSDLFHETDRFSFAEGYASRRINITMLYGLRHN